MNIYKYHSAPNFLSYYGPKHEHENPFYAWSIYERMLKEDHFRVSREPERYFENHKHLFAKVPKIAMDIARDRLGFPDGEDVIGRDAKLAFEYARIIKKRFIKGEDAISKNQDYACTYADEFIKGRWPEAEPAIASNPRKAVYYAKRILKGRFKEAEPAILKDPEYCYYYALDVIKGRWPEGEKVIANCDDDELKEYYAHDVVKGPFYYDGKLIADPK